MIEQKNKFISLCFQFLGNENYVLLKHIHDTLAEIEENSDIDILLFDKKKDASFNSCFCQKRKFSAEI